MPINDESHNSNYISSRFNYTNRFNYVSSKPNYRNRLNYVSSRCNNTNRLNYVSSRSNYRNRFNYVSSSCNYTNRFNYDIETNYLCTIVMCLCASTKCCNMCMFVSSWIFGHSLSVIRLSLNHTRRS